MHTHRKPCENPLKKRTCAWGTIYIYIYCMIWSHQHTCIYAWATIYIYMWSYQHTCIYVCIYIYTCTYIHIYMYIYIGHTCLCLGIVLAPHHARHHNPWIRNSKSKGGTWQPPAHASQTMQKIIEEVMTNSKNRTENIKKMQTCAPSHITYNMSTCQNSVKKSWTPTPSKIQNAEK